MDMQYERKKREREKGGVSAAGWVVGTVVTHKAQCCGEHVTDGVCEVVLPDGQSRRTDTEESRRESLELYMPCANNVPEYL